MNKTFAINKHYLLLTLVLLLTSVLFVNIYTGKDEGKVKAGLADRVEEALKERETMADACLGALDTLGDYADLYLEDGLSLLVVQDSTILYWSDEDICSDRTLEQLSSGFPVVLVNNCYYEVKNRELWDSRFYVFISIKYEYPDSRYSIKDRFAKYMRIPVKNAEQIVLHPQPVKGGYDISDRSGKPIFSLEFDKDYVDWEVNYWLVAIYLLIFILAFVVYDKYMAEEPSVSRQLLYFFLFAFLLVCLFYFSFTGKLPPDLFKLPVFERKMWDLYHVRISVGEILLYVYSLFQIMSITIYRVNSNKRKLRPFRFVIAVLWIMFTYLYVSLYSFATKAMIEQFDVCTNIALVVNVGIISLVVLVTIVLGGVALIIAEDRVFSVYTELISFKEILVTTLVTSAVLFVPGIFKVAVVSSLSWLFYTLLAVALLYIKYYLKTDIQRNAYIVLLFAFSAYLMFVMNGIEQKREGGKREYFAELVQENDTENSIEALTRDGVEPMNYYIYSYAKYDNEGNLIFSAGKYAYNKILTDWTSGLRDGKTFSDAGFDHRVFRNGRSGGFVVVSLPRYYFHLYYYLNILYIFFFVIFVSSYSLIHHLNRRDNLGDTRLLKNRIKNNINLLIFSLFLVMTVSTIFLNTYSFRNREHFNAVKLAQAARQYFEEFGGDSENFHGISYIKEVSEILNTDIYIYDALSGKLLVSSNPDLFRQGYKGNRVNPEARRRIVEDGETNIFIDERIGNVKFKSVYVNSQLPDRSMCIINIPYFIENGEFNRDVATIAIIAINVAIILMMLSFTLSSWIAGRILQPLRVINQELKKMRLDGKNERIVYNNRDEVGLLVRQYNETLEKLEDNVARLARSEREGAWREMARQIAHEIKNPLTPMKLNIQLLQRAIDKDDPEKFRQRFSTLSEVLMEQIDTMAVTASAFSDFAKFPKISASRFNLSSLIKENVVLLDDGAVEFQEDIEDDLWIMSDKFLINRVLMNIMKNAEQSIPDDRKGMVRVSLHKEASGLFRIAVRDNGCGIGEEMQRKVFEPNFTTKSTGMGLGLAISKKIIESLEGTITFESRIGEGTEFIIILKDINRN